MVPPDPTPGSRPWFGHKNGKEHAFAACFIQNTDADRPKWIYVFQGQEGGCSGRLGGDVIYSVTCRSDGAVSESAELDVDYVATK